VDMKSETMKNIKQAFYLIEYKWDGWVLTI